MANRDFQEEQQRYGRRGERGRMEPSRHRGPQSEWDDERNESRFGGREEDAWQSRDEEYGRERPRGGGGAGRGRGWSDGERESEGGEQFGGGGGYGGGGYGGYGGGPQRAGQGERGYRGGAFGGERGASIGGYGGGGGQYRGSGGAYGGGRQGGGYGGGRPGGGYGSGREDDWGYGGGDEARWSGGEYRRRTDRGGQAAYGGQAGYGGSAGSGTRRGGWFGGQGDYGFGEQGGGGYGDDEGGGFEEFGEYGRGQRGGQGGGRGFGGQRAQGVRGLFSGRGPKGYERSDDRIREDVCDRLMDEAEVDASNMTVEVKAGEVTLEGSVDSKEAKRRIEDIAEEVPGVREVQNHLRVERNGASSRYGRTSAESTTPGMRSMSDTAGSTGAGTGATAAGTQSGGAESKKPF